MKDCEYLGENAEKYITFSVPIKKRPDNDKSITYKIKFIDYFRLISTSLSNLVYNLSEGLPCDKCLDCKSCRDHMSVKDDQLIFRCKKNYKEQIVKRIIKKTLIKN